MVDVLPWEEARLACNRLTRGQRAFMASLPSDLVIGTMFKLTPGQRRHYPALVGARLLGHEYINGAGDLFYLTVLGEKVLRRVCRGE